MELSDLARVCRSILYVLMKPMSSNMLRTHCRHTQQDQLHHFRLISLCCLLTALPYQGCGLIRQGARCVRELSVAGVDLHHWFDARHQQLRHLFLWNLQHTHTESYWVNNIDSVSKYNVSACESEWVVQIWFYLHMVHHHFIGQVGPELSFMDFLVEQRLEKQTPYYSNTITNILIIIVTDTWLR